MYRASKSRLAEVEAAYRAKLERSSYFPVLDALRRAGNINMNLAPSYLRQHFDLDREEAYAIFAAWKATFTHRAKVA